MTPEKKATVQKTAKEAAEKPAEAVVEKKIKAKEIKVDSKKAGKEQYEKRVAPQKSEEVKALRDEILEKSRLPSFKGRFGVESIRNPNKKKWSKWRKPRGIDIQRTQEDGARPNIGYRRPNAIRTLHPSGYREVLVFNPKGLQLLEKTTAARISGTVGKRKRQLILDEAQKLGVRIINPIKR